MVRGKLQKIPVSADDRDFHPRLLAPSGQGAKEIVRLQPGSLNDPDAHSLKDFLHHRHLLAKLLHHGLSRPFIVRVHFMAECGGVYVKCHGQILRLLLVQYLQHDIQKTVDGICVESL